jgi:hypothetical protein
MGGKKCERKKKETGRGGRGKRIKNETYGFS